MRLRLVLLFVACAGCSVDDSPDASGSALRPEEQVVVIQGDPFCADCEIRLQNVATLGNASDPSSVRGDAMVEGCNVGRLSNGNFVLSGSIGGGPLLVYGNHGAVIREIGRMGAGPGEFGSDTRLVVGRGDTISVVDESNGRIQTVTSSGQHVRSFRLRGRTGQFALLNNGDFVLHRKPTGRLDDETYLFYLFSPLGEELGRFGKTAREIPELDLWLVSPGRSEGFWTASLWKYEIHYWTQVDSLKLTVKREVEWFPPDGKWDEDMYVRTPPPPMLVHVREAEASRLWTFSVVPDERWQPDSGDRIMPRWSRATFDTMIEVLDLVEGRVIAQRRYDHWIGPICNSDLIYTVVETESGDTRVRVLKPVLDGEFSWSSR